MLILPGEPQQGKDPADGTAFDELQTGILEDGRLLTGGRYHIAPGHFVELGLDGKRGLRTAEIGILRIGLVEDHESAVFAQQASAVAEDFRPHVLGNLVQHLDHRDDVDAGGFALPFVPVMNGDSILEAAGRHGPTSLLEAVLMDVGPGAPGLREGLGHLDDEPPDAAAVVQERAAIRQG